MPFLFIAVRWKVRIDAFFESAQKMIASHTRRKDTVEAFFLFVDSKNALLIALLCNKHGFISLSATVTACRSGVKGMEPKLDL